MNDSAPTPTPANPPTARIPRVPKPLAVGWICFIVPTLSTLAVAYALQQSRSYGYSLFLGVPVVVGMFTALLYQRGRGWNWIRITVLTLANLGIASVLVMMCGLEGFICILMAAILVAALALLGILITWLIQRGGSGRKNGIHCIALAGLPLAMKWEAAPPPSLPLLEQNSSIEVNAPPEVVWRFIPDFTPIAEPPSGLLATGVAYPIAVEMDGSGVGSTRRCILSTGAMPETVTVWEPGRRLEFVVHKTPPCMVETNPFREVHAPHLTGYFQSKRGRFVLVPLPGGRTRIEGTSWFTLDIRPSWYWEPFTRHTVSQIHRRVLLHIKSLAESQAAPPESSGAR